MERILDLSHYNTVVDWNAVKTAVDGVILRVGYRGYVSGKIVADNKFKEYAIACKAVGIPFGLYFMSQAITDKEGAEEGEYSVNMAKLYGATLPIFIDHEDGDGTARVVRADGLSRRQRTEVSKGFCNRVIELGYKAGAYTTEHWYNTKLYYDELKHYYIWVAGYGKNTGVKTSKVTLPKYDLHQYTSKATVYGVEGDCDLSECYVDFDSNTPEQATGNQPVRTPVVTEEDCNMKTIKSGSKGNAVKVWQIIIGVKPDGDFGSKTRNATLEFQKKAFPNNPKEWDGIVGKNSWKAGLESL